MSFETTRYTISIPPVVERYRTVVLGSARVGKTALINQFLSGQFQSEYCPTVEDNHSYLIRLRDGSFKNVEILDTSGSHHFPAMRELNVKSGQAFVIVYSIDDVTSFEEASHLIQLIYNVKGNNQAPVMLVGNKQDLDGQRKVSSTEARRLAVEKNCGHVEISARDGFSVRCTFLKLLHKVTDPKHRPRASCTSPPVRSTTGLRKQLGRSLSSGILGGRRSNSFSVDPMNSVNNNHKELDSDIQCTIL